ncbi:MAG TPA: alpha-amylase family glycosyl hydrolase, partial [Gaiellaceae bacterium]|nr:alpha-amylase family glycosyl hydrolase [Gaiellaceae bacterium]
MPIDDRLVEFGIWAPDEPVSVRVAGAEVELEPRGDGFRSAVVPARPGDRYLYVVDGCERPDPASRSQPNGVRGPSEVVAIPEIRSGPRLALEELVLYELHVGAFTPEGTFDAMIPRLASLRELGVTAIELMPVATGPGNRGWGYDGLYVSAPHPAYGGPAGLARLVDAAHAEGLGVVADVVYNHLGPGSEAIDAFGPYFSDEHTFWGNALDYAQRGVREWAIQNAELFVGEYGIDGLRLDAVHAIVDDSPVHVLRELRDRVKALDPEAFVISEMGPEDFRPLDEWGHDAMWLDSLHHHLHVLLTGEHEGYYESFGSIEGVVRELTREQPERLVVCAQNHDQVGNRASGDRLPPAMHRVALAVCLFSLSTPLLFMGEEYDESRPFQFFTDHIDPEIAEATRAGRKREFENFASFAGEVPDPQDEATFLRSKLEPRDADPFYRELLELRRSLPPELEARGEGDRLVLRRGGAELA